MKLIKAIPRPENTTKYKSWPGDWGIYECPICNNKFAAPSYGISKGFIKSCGCLKKSCGTRNLKNFWANAESHPNGNYMTVDGETLNITEWSNKTGIPRATIKNRIDRGLTPKEILKEYYYDTNQQSNKH